MPVCRPHLKKTGATVFLYPGIGRVCKGLLVSRTSGWKPLLVAVLFASIAANLATAEEKSLRLTFQQSLSDPLGLNLVKFKDEAEAASAGGVHIELLDGGKLFPEYQVPSAVGGGTIEMGVTPLVQYSPFIPAAGVFMQPFLFNFTAIVRGAAQRGGSIRQLIDTAILHETGARVLWWQPGGWNVIISKQSAVKPDGIENKSVRVFDEISAEFVSLCGGKPEAISDSKQAEALDVDLVSATVTSVASVKNYELWKRTRFLSDIRHSVNILATVINEDVWQALPETEKAALSEAAGRAEARGWEAFQKTEDDIYAFARAKGMTVEEPGADDLIAWRVCSSAILESFMAGTGYAGRTIMGAYGKLRADPCCNRAPGTSSP
jgi:C4-dicarboxylate-binding protein DctP